MRSLILAVLCIAVLMQSCGGDASDFRNSRWGDSREAVMKNETAIRQLDEVIMLGVGEHRKVCNPDSLVFETKLTHLLRFSDVDKTLEDISEEILPDVGMSNLTLSIVYNFNDANQLDSAHIGFAIFASVGMEKSHARELTQHAIELHGKPTSRTVGTKDDKIRGFVETTTLMWQTTSSRITLCFERSIGWTFLWSYEAR